MHALRLRQLEWSLLFIICVPALQLAVLPLAGSRFAFSARELAFAVELIVFEVSVVLATVWPNENADSFPQILIEVASVRPTVLPRKETLAMHHVIVPLSLVGITSLLEAAKAMPVTCLPGTIISVAIVPITNALAMSEPLVEASFILILP